MAIKRGWNCVQSLLKSRKRDLCIADVNSCDAHTSLKSCIGFAQVWKAWCAYKCFEKSRLSNVTNMLCRGCSALENNHRVQVISVVVASNRDITFVQSLLKPGDHDFCIAAVKSIRVHKELNLCMEVTQLWKTRRLYNCCRTSWLTTMTYSLYRIYSGLENATFVSLRAKVVAFKHA